jgi:hypothetical protein
LANVVGDVLFGSLNAVAYAVVGATENAVRGSALASELGCGQGESGWSREKESEESLRDGWHCEDALGVLKSKVERRRWLWSEEEMLMCLLEEDVLAVADDDSHFVDLRHLIILLHPLLDYHSHGM